MGDKAAFEELYMATKEPLWKIALTFVKDHELAKDILQDVYVSLYQNRQQLAADLNVNGYLRNAVKYRVSNHFRNLLVRQRHAVEILRDGPHKTGHRIPLEEKEVSRFITDGIGDLPEKCREAFILQQYQQLSHADIATVMGISVKTVEKHISCALRLLKKSLSKIAILPWIMLF